MHAPEAIPEGDDDDKCSVGGSVPVPRQQHRKWYMRMLEDLITELEMKLHQVQNSPPAVLLPRRRDRTRANSDMHDGAAEARRRE